ncbi:MAG: hypothetical protein AMS22_13275 [Thiotrichales bacterium SG8_50]|nr:MAG: hypothetical protein AMS22_13275 [Thiotrichales bacterium SG8_50]
MIDPNGTATTATGIGYKYPFNPNLAIYGKPFLNTATGGQTNITLGASYTMQSGNFFLTAMAISPTPTHLTNLSFIYRARVFTR